VGVRRGGQRPRGSLRDGPTDVRRGRGWPDPPPFRAPAFVLTNRAREPWVRQGGTTSTFVTGGIESALEQAREAADDKDVRIACGAKHLAPVLLGKGVRLFDRSAPQYIELEITRVIDSPRVTHLRYRFLKEEPT
jgi:hypothetical protein